MKLQEICLDLPYVNVKKLPLGVDTINDYKINWKSKRRQFSLETRCMCSMLERIMERKTNNLFWKIIIGCVEKDELFESKIKINDGICYVMVPILYDEFISCGDYVKKKLAIAFIENGLLEISKQIEFDYSYLNNAIEYIKENKYINEWEWKKITRKGEEVSIWIFHDVKEVKIYANIVKGGIENKVLLYKCLPDEWVYSRKLGKLYWADDDTAVLENSEEKIKLT